MVCMHARSTRPYVSTGGAVAPVDESAKQRMLVLETAAATNGAAAAVARLPAPEMAAASHGASRSNGSELPTPVPQQPASEEAASPDMSGTSPPAAAACDPPHMDVGDGAAYKAGMSEPSAVAEGGEGAGTSGAAASGDTGAFEDAQEEQMRATESESEAAAAMRVPGPQSVLQSVDYGR